MTFVFIYIREAHPSDDPRPAGRGRGGGGGGTAPQARSAEERHATAAKCVSSLGLTMTTLIDEINNSTAKAYDGWPDRLFVIDRNMKIAFRGDPGPRGLDPDSWKRKLEKVIANGGYAP